MLALLLCGMGHDLYRDKYFPGIAVIGQQAIDNHGGVNLTYFIIRPGAGPVIADLIIGQGTYHRSGVIKLGSFNGAVSVVPEAEIFS